MPKQSKTPKTREKNILKSEDTPSFYANNIDLSVSTWDFRLKGGEIIQANKDSITIKELFTLYLSPNHAKMLSILLSERVAEYEKRFGELPLQPKAD
ncbi:MAG: DUF3467 domain-containing protein [Nitrospira sp.]